MKAHEQRRRSSEGPAHTSEHLAEQKSSGGQRGTHLEAPHSFVVEGIGSPNAVVMHRRNAFVQPAVTRVNSSGIFSGVAVPTINLHRKGITNVLPLEKAA